MVYLILQSLFKGQVLGLSIFLLGEIADHTIGKQTLKVLNKTKGSLLEKAKYKVFINLNGISPILYVISDQYFLDHSITYPNPLIIANLLLIHNILYYCAHVSFHKYSILYPIHKFHHQFDDLLVPSIGNAVSTLEFILAYVCPFLIGGILFQPSELYFISAIGIIAILNMVIHTNEWKEIKWLKGLVSPKDHITHHKVRNSHYAAPLLSIDDIINRN